MWGKRSSKVQEGAQQEWVECSLLDGWGRCEGGVGLVMSGLGGFKGVCECASRRV